MLIILLYHYYYYYSTPFAHVNLSMCLGYCFAEAEAGGFQSHTALACTDELVQVKE